MPSDGIPETHWRRDEPCPDECLCHNPSKERIVKQVAETRENVHEGHGVYVLECRNRSLKNATGIALDELDVSEIPWWVKAATNYNRLFYVGLSKRMVTRLYNHAHAKGASFTKVFPPVRLLSIDWYPTLAHSYRAEPEKAEYLDKKFPEVFVFQPG